MKKFRKITIYRRDFTVPPTEQELKIDKDGNYRKFKRFQVRINNSIPPDHKILK